jgi:hypothetical protein
VTLRPASTWLQSWPALILLFFVMAGAWAISNPLFAVPDEPAHVVKAVAVWSGQLGGRDTQPGTGVRTYRLPSFWGRADICFATHPDTTPDACPPSFRGSHAVTDVSTAAGAYPPLYYALVGWPSRLLSSTRAVSLMRLVSALLAAVLLAAAVRALAQAVRPGLALAGVLVAVTPMALFLAGSVNPNGFEIAAAVALWAHVLAVVRRAEDGVATIPRNLLVGMVVSGAALAFTRPLSGPFAGLIVVLALCATGWGTLLAMARQRRVLISFATLTGLCLVALGLVYATGLLGAKAAGGTPFPVGSEHLAVIVGTGAAYVQQMIGAFGWLDTPPSNLTLYLWLGLVFALVGASLMLTRLRQNLALGLTLAATLALPVILQSPLTGSDSVVWQGRYTLPIAVGIPLLAVLGIDRGAHQIRGLARRLSLVVAATVGLANLDALYWNLHRYTVGLTSRTVDITLGAWQPRGGSVLWLAVMAAAGVMGVVMVAAAPSRPVGVAADDGASLDPPDPSDRPTDRPSALAPSA